MVTQDILWKGIIEDFFPDFLYFFFPKAADLVDFEKGYTFLDQELEKLMPEGKDKKRRVDKLVKVHLKTGEVKYLLIHIEVQGYIDELFSERMYIYQYRGFDRFKLPIVALAIFTDDSPNYHPTTFEFIQKDWETSLIYKFKTYKLYDQKIEALEKIDNPFAIVMQTAWYGIRKNRPKTDEDLLKMKIDLFKRLLKKGYNKERISRLISFIKHYISFDKKDFFNKFESSLKTITKSKETMGIHEAILHHVGEKNREEGIKIGEEKGIKIGEAKGIKIGEEKSRLLTTKVIKLILKGWSVERITKYLKVKTKLVQEIHKQFYSDND